jgi:hypothetical protein
VESRHLGVESPDGSYSDYLFVNDGRIEVRTRAAGRWKPLTADEISLHFRLSTVVAFWLKAKIENNWTDTSNFSDTARAA